MTKRNDSGGDRLMPVALTEKEFSQHLNTTFRLKLDEQEIELELVQVKGYLPQSVEQAGMERFSIFFEGANVYLPQRVYSLAHEQMGQFEIFLVPVAQT